MYSFFRSKYRRTLFLLSTLGLLLLSCQSKVSEKSIDSGVNSKETEAKLVSQKALAEDMDRFDDYIRNIQNSLTEATSRIKNIIGTQTLSSISIIDVLFEINRQVKIKVPSLKKSYLVTEGTIKLDTSLLEPKCQNFNYRVNAKRIEEITQILISMGSCYTQGAYRDIAVASIKNGLVSFELKNDNLQNILQPKNLIEKIPECTVSKSDETNTQSKDMSSNLLTRINCSLIHFAKTEKIDFYFSLKTEPAKSEILINGFLKNSGNLAFLLILEVDSSGGIKILDQKIFDVSIQQFDTKYLLAIL